MIHKPQFQKPLDLTGPIPTPLSCSSSCSLQRHCAVFPCKAAEKLATAFPDCATLCRESHRALQLRSTAAPIDVAVAQGGLLTSSWITAEYLYRYRSDVQRLWRRQGPYSWHLQAPSIGLKPYAAATPTCINLQQRWPIACHVLGNAQGQDC